MYRLLTTLYCHVGATLHVAAYCRKTGAWLGLGLVACGGEGILDGFFCPPENVVARSLLDKFGETPSQGMLISVLFHIVQLFFCSGARTALYVHITSTLLTKCKPLGEKAFHSLQE